MPVHNADIASVFNEMADLLEIQGENPFRIRAYRNAARTIGDLGRALHEAVEKGEDLTDIPGIGKDLAGKIADLVHAGRSDALEKLRAQFPPGITELLRVQGLGPKRVKTLWKELKIETVADLEKAAAAGKIRTLAGFGDKMEQNILQSVRSEAVQAKRFRRATAMPYAETLKAYLENVAGVSRVTIGGSYRRGKDTVGDLDFLVIADDAAKVMERFVSYDEVAQVLAKGDTKSSVVLRSGIQCDLRVVPPESYGAALQYFTGSKAHNIATRAIAQKRNLKLNEYGLFKGDQQLAGRTEEDLYDALGLPWVPPELREDRGELAAKPLPVLVELNDLKGDLHNHSTWSDGAATIEEMAKAAKGRGFEYLAITDHSKRLTVANGLDEKRLRRQIEEIGGLAVKGIAILKGIEVDILEDGSLDLPDEVLGELDLVVASVHGKFNLSREKQTERILRAMDHPHFSILAHPTGRLILSREPYDVDMERVISHAKHRGCALELNANPERLDLNDVHVKLAKDAGVPVSINCDGHHTRDFDNLAHGVVQARRGWLEKKDVLNTRPLRQLRSFLATTMSM
jgi:DNA polymerase (family 10)